MGSDKIEVFKMARELFFTIHDEMKYKRLPDEFLKDFEDFVKKFFAIYNNINP